MKIQIKTLIKTISFVLASALSVSVAKAGSATKLQKDTVLIGAEVRKDLSKKQSCFEGSVSDFIQGTSEASQPRSSNWKVLEVSDEETNRYCTFFDKRNQVVGYDEAIKAVCPINATRVYAIAIQAPLMTEVSRGTEGKIYEVAVSEETVSEYRVKNGDIVEASGRVVSKDQFLSCTALN